MKRGEHTALMEISVYGRMSKITKHLCHTPTKALCGRNIGDRVADSEGRDCPTCCQVLIRRQKDDGGARGGHFGFPVYKSTRLIFDDNNELRRSG